MNCLWSRTSYGVYSSTCPTFYVLDLYLYSCLDLDLEDDLSLHPDLCLDLALDLDLEGDLPLLLDLSLAAALSPFLFLCPSIANLDELVGHPSSQIASYMSSKPVVSTFAPVNVGMENGTSSDSCMNTVRGNSVSGEGGSCRSFAASSVEPNDVSEFDPMTGAGVQYSVKVGSRICFSPSGSGDSGRGTSVGSFSRDDLAKRGGVAFFLALSASFAFLCLSLWATLAAVRLRLYFISCLSVEAPRGGLQV
ncbi:hypothetical protein M404DRAFT_35911 [Pisolithus tinctorius Marx 270]|uniref:Uncharacterized protein n=1 Tax=Pisolithus tinctorius Marx 270 TaxID=870435 RepID=A0A0C3MXL0_PISTI|nr:hypothetical protein M404DRAFT_35911 [Pisolithus tinctorius Marx 270]